MRTWRILILAGLMTLVVPVFVFSASEYFTTTDPAALANPDPDGLTMSTAVYAPTTTELLAAFEVFRTSIPEGQMAVVYWYNHTNNNHDIFFLWRSGVWDVGDSSVPGVPCSGINLTPPLVAGGLVALAAALLGAGWFLLRRQQRMQAA